MSSKERDEYNLIRIKDVISPKDQEKKYLIVWKKATCNTFENSWHTLGEIMNMGYSKVIQDFENIRSASSSKPIILANDEMMEETKDDRKRSVDDANEKDALNINLN